MFKTAKRITLITLMLALTYALHAQQVTRTYYDYRKTQVNEEYQANSAGYINGYYKKYDTKGLLKEQGSAINGKLNGEYRKWATYSGSRELASVETYKDGVLSGPAKYYANGGIVVRSGNFLDGEKEGVWEEFYSSGSDGGCQYFKSRNVYKKGTQESRTTLQDAGVSFAHGKPNVYITSGDKSEGMHKEYYYPCKKIYSEYSVVNGQVKGVHKLYYSTGEVLKEITYHYPDGKESVLTYKSYHPNGKLEYDYDAGKTPVFFAQYDANGSLAGMAKKFAADEEEKRKLNETTLCYKKADSLFLAKMYEDADSLYIATDKKTGYSNDLRLKALTKLRQAIAYEDKNEAMSAYDIYSWLIANMAQYKELNALIYKVAEKNLDLMEKYFELNSELEKQSLRINEKMVLYAESYVKKTATGATYNNEPLYATTYPKGKLIFEKSKSIISPQLIDYNQNLTALISKSSRNSFGSESAVDHPTIDELMTRVKLGEQVEGNLDRMISLSSVNTDEYNKSLRKAKDEMQIRLVIGLK